MTENLATDIDLGIAMWMDDCKIVGVNWRERCELRKIIYDIIVENTSRVSAALESAKSSHNSAYAVKKDGRKSALRVLQTEKDAFQWCAENGYLKEGNGVKPGFSIEFRQGESTRCEKYCSVKDWCQQYAEILGVS